MESFEALAARYSPSPGRSTGRSKTAASSAVVGYSRLPPWHLLPCLRRLVVRPKLKDLGVIRVKISRGNKTAVLRVSRG